MTSSQHLWLTLALALALLCALGAVLSGLGTRLGWWDFRVGFVVLRWSVYLLVLPLLLAVLAAALAIASGVGPRDIRYGVVLLSILLVFGLPFFYINEFRRSPTLADATTNFADPPAFVALVPLREQSAGNPQAYRGEEAAVLQRRYFADLVTLYTQRTPEEVVARAAAAARRLGWEVVAEAPAEGRLEATATTFWFGFRDDVVLRARPAAQGQTAVDVRSASRVGLRDGGANAKRVRTLLAALAEG